MAEHPLLQRDLLGVIAERLTLRAFYALGRSCRTTWNVLVRNPSPAVAKFVSERKEWLLSVKFQAFLRLIWDTAYPLPLHAKVRWNGVFDPSVDLGGVIVAELPREPAYARMVSVNTSSESWYRGHAYGSFVVYCQTGSIEGSIPFLGERTKILWKFIRDGRRVTFPCVHTDMLVDFLFTIGDQWIHVQLVDEKNRVCITKERWAASFSVETLVRLETNLLS
jgi:hypothetical protein